MRLLIYSVSHRWVGFLFLLLAVSLFVTSASLVSNGFVSQLPEKVDVIGGIVALVISVVIITPKPNSLVHQIHKSRAEIIFKTIRINHTVQKDVDRITANFIADERDLMPNEWRELQRRSKSELRNSRGIEVQGVNIAQARILQGYASFKDDPILLSEILERFANLLSDEIIRQRKEAVRIYEVALEINPLNLEAWIGLAEAIAHKNRGEAAHVYDRAVNLTVNNTKPFRENKALQLNRFRAHTDRSPYHQIKEVCEEIVGIHPLFRQFSLREKGEIYYWLAAATAMEGKVPEAEHYLDEAVAAATASQDIQAAVEILEAWTNEIEYNDVEMPCRRIAYAIYLLTSSDPFAYHTERTASLRSKLVQLNCRATDFRVLLARLGAPIKGCIVRPEQGQSSSIADLRPDGKKKWIRNVTFPAVGIFKDALRQHINFMLANSIPPPNALAPPNNLPIRVMRRGKYFDIYFQDPYTGEWEAFWGTDYASLAAWKPIVDEILLYNKLV